MTRILLFTGKGGVGKTTTAAATAETIRFLSLPDILSRYMERLFPVGRRVNKVVAPVLSRVTSLILTDPQRTSVRLVVNPERIVIAEARRTYTYLSLFGYRVDAVVANRLLPDEVADPWFARWKALHLEHLQAIEEGFAPLPVLKVELAPTELVGLDALRDFGGRVYGDLDPAARLHVGQPLKVHRRNGRTTLSLELPFADRDDLELGRRADELLVRVGPYRRAVTLPDSLRRRPVVDATLKRGKLRVIFEGRADDGER